MKHVYDPKDGKSLIGNFCAGMVRVVGLASGPNELGFSGWIEVEAEVQDDRGGDAFGIPIRVNPGLVQLATRSRLSYGGGVHRGEIQVEYTRRPFLAKVHKLTQYLRKRDQRVPVPIGALGFEVAPGNHNGASPLAFSLLAGKTVLNAADHVNTQEYFPVGGADSLILHSSPKSLYTEETYFQIDWHIDL